MQNYILLFCTCSSEALESSPFKFTGKTGPLHSMEVLFPEYFRRISTIFPHHGQHLRTIKLDKTIEIGFYNLFLQYFHTMEEFLFSQ